MSHDELYKAVLEAIDELFSDTGVPQEETKKSLAALIEEIEILIDSPGEC